MSSTVWLKLFNSNTGKVLLLEDDYISFTSVIPDLKDECIKLNVMIINEMVDYGDAAEGMADDIPDDIEMQKFTQVQISEAIRTLSALNRYGNEAVRNDIKGMLKTLTENSKDYDGMALVFIL